MASVHPELYLMPILRVAHSLQKEPCDTDIAAQNG